MTERQRRFVDSWIETVNATESAKKAGYSPKTSYSMGQQLLKNIEVQKAIDARMKELESSRIASASEVMMHLTASMRGQIQEEVVVVEGDGDGRSSARIIGKQISARDRLKAAELLAKRYSLTSAEDLNAEKGEVTIVDDADQIE